MAPLIVIGGASRQA